MPIEDPSAADNSPLPDPNPYLPAEPPGQLLDIEHVDAVFASLDAPLMPEPLVPVRQFRRSVRKPVLLFVATLFSTFLAGVSHFEPFELILHMIEFGAMPLRRAILTDWQNGLLYMASIMSILLSHELGHFLLTLRYGVPATLPYFIPFPINAIGTMGAVIAMDGGRANRREIFDIGIAGPLAGLLFAVPLVLFGATRLDFNAPASGALAFDLPLGVRWFLNWLAPAGYDSTSLVYLSQMNPYFMAGWAGFLVTGLNMLPVSQLDGGHVVYCLLGRYARWFSRLFLVSAIAYVVYANVMMWGLMLLIVVLLGPDHPPTRDDSAELGTFRTVLGWSSWLIPILCFPVNPFRFM